MIWNCLRVYLILSVRAVREVLGLTSLRSMPRTGEAHESDLIASTGLA